MVRKAFWGIYSGLFAVTLLIVAFLSAFPGFALAEEGRLEDYDGQADYWADYNYDDEQEYVKGEQGRFVTQGGVVYWVGKEKAFFSSFVPGVQYIHIPPTLEGVPISLRNFFYCPTTAKEVVIGKGVMGVYHLNFVDCHDLTKVAIYADAAQDYVVPNRQDRYQEAILANCPNLASFIFMGNHHVSKSIFYISKCSMLQEFVMPEKRESFSEIHFLGGEKPKNLIIIEGDNKRIIDGVTYYWDENDWHQEGQGSRLADYSSSKKEPHFTVPNHVKEISTSAFANNTHLKTLLISTNVHTANLGVNHLQAINVSPGNKNYQSIDGVLYDEKKSELLIFPSEKPALTFTILPTVTHISHFSSNYLQALHFSEGIRQLPNFHHYDFHCPNLKTLYLPSTLEDISELYDMEIPLLEEVVVPDSHPYFTTIDGALFSKGEKKLLYCPPGKKGTYTIPEGTLFVHPNAFTKSNHIKTLVFPKSLLYIDPISFQHFSTLKQVEVPIENPCFYFENGGLYNKNKTILIAYTDKKSSYFDVPVGTKIIGACAFMNNSNLEVVTLPYTVTQIRPSAFEGAQVLKTVALPAALQNIGERAFYHCLALEKMFLPKSLTALEPLTFGYAFDWIDDGYSFLSREANYCPRLEIWLPSSITTIGEDAFENRLSKHELLLVVNQNSPAHRFAVESDYYYYRFPSEDTIIIPEQQALAISDLSASNLSPVAIFPSSSATIPIKNLPPGTAITISSLPQEGRVLGTLGNEQFYVNRSDILTENDNYSIFDSNFYEDILCFSTASFDLLSLPYEEATVLTTYPPNTSVTIVERFGPWFQVTIGKKTGYALCSQFSLRNQNDWSDSFEAVVVGKDVRQLLVPLYPYPGFDAPVSNQLFTGTIVDVTFIGEGWYSTSYGYLPFESVKFLLEND